ncbi:MAG: hypothetical protein NC433_14630 [Clostridiales bacterium]|nr:hypothetical protein [Clostridiales bacterium]
MKYRKSIFMAIYMFAIMMLLSGCGGTNKNSGTFQSEKEMSEIINGIWKTGDTEFDFILSIENDKVNLSMEGKDDEGAADIIYVPDDGYFYYLYEDSEGNESKAQYSVVNENGEYVIKDDNWTFKKVE